ncbi:MAG: hypothetical protein HY427_03690 [Candidatus Levybacteria bacterium]|nr:hypothetical protein [Candidatus Levybacteria bacterium]
MEEEIKSDFLSEVKSERENLEKVRDEIKQEREKMERLRAEDIMSGRAPHVVPQKEPELSPREYARLVDEGKIGFTS